MPSFFNFTQGSESSSRPGRDSDALLGRFRAVPRNSTDYHTSQRNRNRNRNSIFASLGYGSIFGSNSSSSNSNSNVDSFRDFGDDDVPELGSSISNIWLRPQQGPVRVLLDSWAKRWLTLVVLPAGIAVTWCALPFPQYPLPAEMESIGMLEEDPHSVPGHGQARVQVNFWFFLLIYYGFYNLTALMWITKLFNIYSLNWWPQSVGFPITFTTIAAVSIAVPIPLYYIPETREYLTHNTMWIIWTFVTMAMPVGVAFGILMSHERHLGLRQSLSETQRIFTQSWWTNESDIDTMARRDRRRPPVHAAAFHPDAPLDIGPDAHGRQPLREAARLRKLWIPASFMRFIWFCMALAISLAAYVLGETYAEIYLRTLPHSSIETIAYVYSWVGTIHILDGLTGWILGGSEGERVGSYPLGWIFKLYFSLTYQTYVRALYARLRKKEQFIILQIISSTGLIILQPLTMSRPYHSLLVLLKFNNQPYSAYQKFSGRSIFIRSLSENVSMIAFLGQILVLHYGRNRDVYPYFAFDTRDVQEDGYDFGLTFWAASVTWACEITAAWIVRRIVGWVFSFDVASEGRRDLWEWPELLPTSAAVMVHVLQNMLFSIIRLQFH